MLAYAAQGLPSDKQSASGEQLREFLRRFDDALTGLADTYRALIAGEGLRCRRSTRASCRCWRATPSAAQAGLRVVMAQANISSQLVDNLNASIHVRALLTDVFLIDELLKQQ